MLLSRASDSKTVLNIYFLFSLLFFIMPGCKDIGKQASIEPVLAADTIVTIKPELQSGIPVDSFLKYTGTIKPNRFLSDILIEYGIMPSDIDQVIRNSGDVLDVKKIRSGKSYTIFYSDDSLGKAAYMLYEHDDALSYVFSFRDSLNITPFRKQIRRVLKYSSGVIETSLWDAMITGNIHPSLSAELSEIYAWTVDFFGLQKGDGFKIIYEELFIDEKSIGAGRIYGSEFTWSGKTIKAIPFIQDEKESWYDQDGNSLRKAFLKAPLSYSRISSRYSSSRLHPVLRIRRPHYGVDYAAPVGTPVQSIGDGRVTFAGLDGANGNIVRITHNSVYATAYLHLSRFGNGIRAGVSVNQGDIVGYVGSSGLSTGPHLDFRFYKNGSPVDPLKVEAPSVDPVMPENIERFSRNRVVIEELLSLI